MKIIPVFNQNERITNYLNTNYELLLSCYRSKTSSKKKGKRDLEEEVSDALIKMAKRDEEDTKFQNQLMESMAGFFKVMTQKAQAPAPQPVNNFSPRTPVTHQNFSTPPQVPRPWIPMSPDSYNNYSPQPSYDNYGLRHMPYSSPTLDRRHSHPPSAAAGIVPARKEDSSDEIINVVDNEDEFRTFRRLTAKK